MKPVVWLRMLLAGASRTSNGMTASRVHARELAPQHVERDVGGESTHALAIGGPLQATDLRAIRRRKADKDETTVFAIRPRIAGDGQRVVRSCSGPSTLRHRLRYRLAHRAVLPDQHRADAEELGIHLIGVSDEAAAEIIRRRRNCRDSSAQEPAGGAFSHAQRSMPRAQQIADYLFQ